MRSPARRLPASFGPAKGAVIGIMTCQDLGCRWPLGAGRAGAEPSFVSTLQPSWVPPMGWAPTALFLLSPGSRLAGIQSCLREASRVSCSQEGPCLGMPELWQCPQVLVLVGWHRLGWVTRGGKGVCEGGVDAWASWRGALGSLLAGEAISSWS